MRHYYDREYRTTQPREYLTTRIVEGYKNQISEDLTNHNPDVKENFTSQKLGKISQHSDERNTFPGAHGIMKTNVSCVG